MCFSAAVDGYSYHGEIVLIYRKVGGSEVKFLYIRGIPDEKLYPFIKTPPERPERADHKSGVIL